MTRGTSHFQPLVLGVAGVIIVALGGNIALGGFETLGMQFPPAGLSAADPLGLQRHDSNVRFLGGVFAGIGMLVAFSAWFERLRLTAAALLLVLPLGGLARLLQPGYSVLADSAFYGSLFTEFVAAPLFALWILRTPTRIART